LGRQGIDHDGSTAAADAAQALVNFFFVPPHLLQRLHRSGVENWLGLAFGGQRIGLTLVAGLALSLRLDKPALLDLRRSGSRSVPRNG